MEETNRLIAEFMGFTKEKNLGYYDNNENMSQVVYDVQNGNCFDELLFDKSWDWLMSVVEKIEDTNLSPTTENSVNVTIGATSYCVIQDNYGEKFEIVGQDKTKLLSVYQAVVKFIKRINNKNDNRGK